MNKLFSLKEPSAYQDIVYRIIGAAMTVQDELNWGLAEAFYTEALHIELEQRGIENKMECQVPCFYKGQRMEKHYQPDIMVGEVMIELKSVSELISAHRAQLFNYMRLTRTPISLLINFGQPLLQGERYWLNEETNECILLDRNMNPVYDNPNSDYYGLDNL